MTGLLFAALLLALLASLPHWLPQVVIALRTRLFTAINGEEGLAVPGELVAASRFKEIYSHPAANGRSRGARLSDLFWYWLSPGPELHQEHLEPGPRYDEVAKTTRRLLALSKRDAEALAARSIRRVLLEREKKGARSVRLRELMLPVWADFYYELVFGEPCPHEARALIVANADDVVTALKCCSLRHMGRRHRLTRYLQEKLRTGALAEALPACLSLEERALYLQGVFFNTAVVQMSEAMTHLVLVVAEHELVQRRLTEDDTDQDYLERLITEVLRLYPLFGISHRITTDPIELDPQTTIPPGAVLCFNHAEFHRHGFDEPERLDPDRWRELSPRETSYIPFGVPANRPCPAQAIALISLRAAVRELLTDFRVASSVRHTRSIPSGGPCLLIPRGATRSPRREALALVFLRFRDRWEDVVRSVAQLAFGTFMLWHARRLRLCERYFERARGDSGHGSAGAGGRACPVGERAARGA
jgi:hypothetical protein